MKDINEAAAPAKIERKLLEKDVQKQCVDWARARGYWARKFSSQSQRSVPDYLFSCFLPLTIKFACEFKRPGTKLTKKPDGTMSMSTQAQYDEQVAMHEAGWFVFECDNFDKFKKTVIAYEESQA